MSEEENVELKSRGDEDLEDDMEDEELVKDSKDILAEQLVLSSMGQHDERKGGPLASSSLRTEIDLLNWKNMMLVATLIVYSIFGGFGIV